jgi:hypothetical protein
MRKHPLTAAALLGVLLLAGTPSIGNSQDGFLFRAPMGQLTLRAGPLLPRAQSDLFEFLTDTLTLGKQDFRAPLLSAELSFTLTPRFDLALAAGWAQAQSRSEFRDWVGDDDLPIQQETRLRSVPVTLSGRFYPLERGRTVSRLAWLPARTTPYVGGGAGVTWYGLRQEGEFIDTDRRIFESTLESNEHGYTGHVLAGVDHWFTPRVGLNADVRYTWGSAPVGGSYRGWDSMDLGGMQLGVGISFRW